MTTPPALPDGFTERLFARIRVLEARRARFFFAVRTASALASAACFALMVRLTIDSASATGFAEYARLTLSDWNSLMSSWQDFGFALLESLPAAGLAGCVAALFAFSLSVLPRQRLRHEHA